MPRLRDIDLNWTSNGDFALDASTGDMKDTSLDEKRTLIQRVVTRLLSSRGDWDLEPHIGAGLGSFVGRVNSEETARLMKSRITSELFSIGVNSQARLDVDIIPFAKDKVLIVIDLMPIGSTDRITLKFLNSLSDNRVIQG